LPQIQLASDVNDHRFDGVIIVTNAEQPIPAALLSSQSYIKEYLKVCGIVDYVEMTDYFTLK
jgi:hypothetical protein